MPPEQSYFLFGPREAGKSTWLKNHCPNAYWINLLDPETFRFFSARPEKLESILAITTSTKVVVIDEIQKLPELLDVIHILIEKKQDLLFVMTGSSSRKLKQQGVNLLGSRALLRHMPPFFAVELDSAFSTFGKLARI